MQTLAAPPPGIVMDLLEKAYETFGPRLYHYLLGMLRSEADAEDALQTVFVKLARRQGRGIDDLTAYLFSAARNEAVRLAGWRGRTDTPGSERAPWLLQPEPDPDREEERLKLEGVLASLPSEQREVILLKVWEGLTFREIAAVTGVPQDTAASRYRYALEKLKERMS